MNKDPQITYHTMNDPNNLVIFLRLSIKNQQYSLRYQCREDGSVIRKKKRYNGEKKKAEDLGRFSVILGKDGIEQRARSTSIHNSQLQLRRFIIQKSK